MKEEYFALLIATCLLGKYTRSSMFSTHQHVAFRRICPAEVVRMSYTAVKTLNFRHGIELADIYSFDWRIEVGLHE